MTLPGRAWRDGAGELGVCVDEGCDAELLGVLDAGGRVVEELVREVPDIVEQCSGDEPRRRVVVVRRLSGPEHVLAQRDLLAVIRVVSEAAEALESRSVVKQESRAGDLAGDAQRAVARGAAWWLGTPICALTKGLSGRPTRNSRGWAGSHAKQEPDPKTLVLQPTESHVFSIVMGSL